MSDDTPTQRFEPTTPLAAADGSTSTTTGPPDEGRKRGMLIALIAIAAAILLALVVLIVVLVGNAGGSTETQPTPDITASESPEPTPEESESPEPSDEPSASPSATTAPPAPQSPSFATFSGPDRADCPDTSSSVAITWSWSSTNAVAAWFGIGTNDAKAQPFESVPTTATYTFNYQCSEPSQRYTVTLEDSAGRLTHSTVVIVRQ